MEVDQGKEYIRNLGEKLIWEGILKIGYLINNNIIRQFVKDYSFRPWIRMRWGSSFRG